MTQTVENYVKSKFDLCVIDLLCDPIRSIRVAIIVVSPCGCGEVE